MMTDLSDVYQAILGGQLEPAVALTKEAIENKVSPETIINDYMVKAMEEVGRKFEIGEAFVPELLMSARAMKGCLELLKPLMQGEKAFSLGKVVIGTVKGDLHDIGKGLVASMLEGCGFEVVNLGTDVPSEKFIAAVQEHQAEILCMSALLTTTMSYMQLVIQALDEAGMRNRVKVMVGGAPITEQFARQIGADGYSSNANGAVVKAKELINA